MAPRLADATEAPAVESCCNRPEVGPTGVVTGPHLGGEHRAVSAPAEGARATVERSMNSARVIRRTFDEPDDSLPTPHGRSFRILLGDEEVWRSELEPGWSWDYDLAPLAEGATSCPLTHREYVISGTIRYTMDDGTEFEARQGDLLFIPPGHRATVVGDETCVVLDW